MSSKTRKRERKKEVNVTINQKSVKKVHPNTKNQRELAKAIYTLDMVFCEGPAGTGKTHISVGVAVDLFQRRKAEKIIITRPMVEAGQKGGKSVMGYLPGAIKDKMMGFLRPLYDELGKFLTSAQVKEMEDTQKLEICPLVHMRGRTFENAVIICDEAQNATEEELEMLATRLGKGSKLIIVGDYNQCDLPSFLAGGFENIIDDIDTVEGFGIVYLQTCDIARHPLVRKFLERRQELKNLYNKPASLERVVEYEAQKIKRGEDPSSECELSTDKTDIVG